MRRLATLAVMLVFAWPAAAHAHGFSPRTLQDSHVGTSKPELLAQRDYSDHVIGTILARRNRWRIAPRHSQCWSLRGRSWRSACDHARRRLLANRWLRSVAERRLAALERRELVRSTGTYLGAVAYVERYFGPEPFLRDCPNGEGGYGAWVPNSSGSGAGGWLQFMSGTFYGIIGRAIATARARGMVVPDSAKSWYSPLGQALAGVQMVADGRRGEWTGPNC